MRVDNGVYVENPGVAAGLIVNFVGSERPLSAVDVYLWDEQREFVQALLPEVVEANPGVSLWYALRGDGAAFIAAGAVVAQWCCYAWLGCPRDQEIGQYLSSLGLFDYYLGERGFTATASGADTVQ